MNQEVPMNETSDAQLRELQVRAARVVNEWHVDDLTSDAVAHLAELVPEDLIDEDQCALCGEAFAEEDERAEMYDPSRPDDPTVTCHADCGLSRGLEVA
jgi:hypothetical protein